MPVYNVKKYVVFAIESILSQTFEHYKLLIIDDASIYHTLDVIYQYHDKRIKVIKNHTNLGIVNSLNKGLTLIVLQQKGQLQIFRLITALTLLYIIFISSCQLEIFYTCYFH